MSCCCTDRGLSSGICIWVGLVKFEGGGFVLKFDVFQHCYAVFVLFASPACKQ